jgi:hypothetical protein
MLFGIQSIHEQIRSAAVFFLASRGMGTESKPSLTARNDSSGSSDRKPTEKIYSE